MNRLKELRKKSKYTVDNILEIVKISQSYYYQLEKNERRLNQDLIDSFCNIFSVTADYLLGKDECSTPPTTPSTSSDLPPELQGIVDEIIVDTKLLLEEGVPQEEVEATLDVAHQILKLKKNNTTSKNCQNESSSKGKKKAE